MTIRGVLKAISSIFIPVALVGCVSGVNPMHPPLPEPVEPIPIEWHVESVDGKARVYLSWEDSQKFKVWLEDFKRYTLESKVLMCYYREELDEERCKK